MTKPKFDLDDVIVHREPLPADVRRGANVYEADNAICLFPGCEEAAVPPPEHGGPKPAYCSDDEHNVISAHNERKRLEAAAAAEAEA